MKAEILKTPHIFLQMKDSTYFLTNTRYQQDLTDLTPFKVYCSKMYLIFSKQ